MDPFPYENVKIEAKETSQEVIETVSLLDAVYNGSTKLKTIESANIRNQILDEIIKFQDCLCKYYKANTGELKNYLCMEIKNHLSRGSNFTAFKRWIILDNVRRKNDFEQYFD